MFLLSRVRSTPLSLAEEGGIEGTLEREVLSYAPDVWYVTTGVKIGEESSFNRYFCKREPMRTLEEIRTEILELERDTQGLLDDIIGVESR